MTQEFFGNWTVQVITKEAAFSERFVIDGSDFSDGAYDGETTTPPVSVTGARWRISLEWNDNAGSGWQPSDVNRIDASYTLQDGLAVVLGADDNYPQYRDGDYDDVVLRCTSDDSAVNPWHPFVNPYDFTVPEDARKRSGPVDTEQVRDRPWHPCKQPRKRPCRGKEH
jgi:hypothetical protein